MMYQESTYHFDDDTVREDITKLVVSIDLCEAFARLSAWVADHKDAWVEDTDRDTVVEICTDIDDNVQHCAKILFDLVEEDDI